MDMFLFYLFFEVGLVPMYFLIGIWGGDNRLYAAIKFFLYTLVGSVVMLLGILKMYFLTQDTTLTAKIVPATLDLLAGNKDAAALVSTTIQTAAQNNTGTFNILYMVERSRFITDETGESSCARLISDNAFWRSP